MNLIRTIYMGEGNERSNMFTFFHVDHYANIPTRAHPVEQFHSNSTNDSIFTESEGRA